jgi:NAD(P)-dependent dehydrogenase (short-subunit alcohol dehydrogenase family)
MRSVRGCSVLVTGAASGLGAAAARFLAREGAHVTLLDLDEANGQKMAEEIKGTFVKTDITKEDQVLAAIKAATSTGPLRGAVNCAGIAPPAKIVGKKGAHSLDLFTKVINVNLIGTFNVTRLAAASMVTNEPIDGERGLIVNTASIAAYEGQIGQAAYSASKGGVVAMTLPIARELASQGVRVNTIAPGIMGTPMLAGLPQAAQDSLGKTVPFPQRMGRPEEYASLVHHIFTNGYINGEVIRIDGSLRMP